MERSEFLKRFGLGVAAAVTAPALLKGEEKAEKYHESACNHVDAKEGEHMVFWRSSDEARIITTSCYTYELPKGSQIKHCEPSPISIDFDRGHIINNETGEITNFNK